MGLPVEIEPPQEGEGYTCRYVFQEGDGNEEEMRATGMQ